MMEDIFCGLKRCQTGLIIGGVQLKYKMYHLAHTQLLDTSVTPGACTTTYSNQQFILDFNLWPRQCHRLHSHVPMYSLYYSTKVTDINIL